MLQALKQPRGFYRSVARLALPILLQNLITTSLGLVDTLMVGTLGEVPLAAVTLANIPVFVIQLVVFGLQSGSSVLLSQFWGKQDLENINRVIGVGFYVAGILAALFALVMGLFPRTLMGLLTPDSTLVALAAQYARIVGVSYLLNSLTGVYTGAQRSMENPRLGLIVFSISMCTNTFLNWVLIFGRLGAPALGVVGAALATLTARIVEFVITAIYAIVNRRFKLKPALLLRPGRALLVKFLRYSSPVVCNEALWGLGVSLHKVIMGHMEHPAEILAARALSGNIEDILQVAIIALGGTTAILIGREIGSGQRRERVYSMAVSLTAMSTICGVILGVLMIGAAWLILPRWVYPFFQLSKLAGGIASLMLTVTGAFLPLRGFNSVAIVGVFRAGGDVRAAMILDLFPLWLVALPLAALFGLVLQWGILWVCLSVAMEQVAKFIPNLRRFRSQVWINDVTQLVKEG
ncbi:MAG: MATE family efflux transporter [Oscillospiraceae bacterium]|nr:MATE family efflux transporter [Oscillospiraceae bacterium]